jgi:hypothetical protein
MAGRERREIRVADPPSRGVPFAIGGGGAVIGACGPDASVGDEQRLACCRPFAGACQKVVDQR